jgi:hypothetical protein
MHDRVSQTKKKFRLFNLIFPFFTLPFCLMGFPIALYYFIITMSTESQKAWEYT